MVIITEKQKNELSNILDEGEMKVLLEDNIADFFTDLHLFIMGYMDDDYNHTSESYKLDQLYDEIYKQNDESES